jgi:hypothetical protein
MKMRADAALFSLVPFSLALFSLVLVLMPHAAQGGDALDFWHRSLPVDAPVTAERACLDAIETAARTEGVDAATLTAIGLTEAGRGVAGAGDGSRASAVTIWPWTVHDGDRGQYFPNRSAAERAVRDARRAGRRSIDVGCLQVNLRWHGDAVDDPLDLLDPATNVRVAARFLKRLSERYGAEVAIGAYHSRSDDLATAYRARVEANASALVGGGVTWPVAQASLGSLFAPGPRRALVGDGPRRPLLPEFDTAAAAENRGLPTRRPAPALRRTGAIGEPSR